MACVTSTRELEFWHGLSTWQPGTQGTLSLWVSEGVSEMRIDYGPGYRVYYKKYGREVVILLAGGDKRSQARDIKTALRLARNL